MTERACENCGVSLAGRRKDARFCGDPCRYAVWAGKRAESSDNGSQRLSQRLPSREGKGIRIYVTREDTPESLLRKWGEAKERAWGSA